MGSIEYYNPTNILPGKIERCGLNLTFNILTNLSSCRNSTQGVVFKLRWVDERSNEDEGREGDPNQDGTKNEGKSTHHTLPGFSIVLVTEQPSGTEKPSAMFLIFPISLLSPEVVVFLRVGQLFIITRDVRDVWQGR